MADLQAEIRHSHGQHCFPTNGQHVHGEFRTETPHIAPKDLKPKLWKRYVDNILEVVKRA